MNSSSAYSLEGLNISLLISKLCDYFARNNKDTSLRLFKVCTNFLVTSASAKLTYDEQYIVNEIRKTLLMKQSVESVQSFDLLYSTIHNAKILRNKTSLLVLFLNLYKDVNSQQEFTMLQQLKDTKNLKVIDIKSQLSFVPEDTSQSIKKLYTSSNLVNHNSIHSGISTDNQNLFKSESQLQIALKDKTSSTSCSTYNSVQGISEYELMQEVIYSMQGIEGKILKKEPGGFGFVVDSKMGKMLSPLQTALMERLASVGFLHNQLKRHCDESDKQNGVIGQSLIAVFRQKLASYYETLAILQAQLKMHSSDLTLRRMLVCTADQHTNLQWLAYIAEHCANRKGGALISAIHGFLQHGSVTVQMISNDVLLAVCRPLYLMLSRWLLDGELNDPSAEFFIEARNISRPECLWHDKYHVKVSMVPSFISMEQAKKILATGKNINFLRHICKDSNQLPGRESLQKLFTTVNADCVYLPDKCIEFHLNLETVYRETSHRVLHMLKNKYQLLEHLQALRRYLLLGQGDFIRHLLELLAPELCKPAQTLYAHTLSAILESAIRVTNAQYEPEEILQRLTVQVLHHSPGDIGWDIFTLMYIVSGPIGTIFEHAMPEYRRLFGSLWKAKRMEYVLSNMRKQQISGAKLFRNVKGLRPILHEIHILSSAMIHFLHQTQYYFLFEVMECSWAEMMRLVNQAECLDDVINAHTNFLNSVQCGVLLDNGSEEMCFQLRSIYSLILQLESTQETLYKAASDEHTAILLMEKNCAESRKNGKFGNSLDQDKVIKERLFNFNNILNFTKGQIKQISYRHNLYVEKYLDLLARSLDLNLQLLSVRLNFNDFYKVA